MFNSGSGSPVSPPALFALIAGPSLCYKHPELSANLVTGYFPSGPLVNLTKSRSRMPHKILQDKRLEPMSFNPGQVGLSREVEMF